MSIDLTVRDGEDITLTVQGGAARRTEENIEDIVGGLVEAATGSNISVTYDDAGDSLTIDTTALNEEEVEDAVAALTVGGDGIDVSYDDGVDTLTVSIPDGEVTEAKLAFDTATQAELDSHTATADAHHAKTVRYTDEEVEDVVGALVAGGTNVTATYDDGAGTLTIDTSALNEEEVGDAVAALLSAGNAISLTYDDPGDTLTVAVDESALSFYDGTNLTADVDNSAVTTESQTIADDGGLSYQFKDRANSVFNGGQTREFTIEGAELADQLIAGVAPQNDPDNDHGYVVDSVFWDDSAGEMMIRITETENAGGGIVRWVVWEVPGP